MTTTTTTTTPAQPDAQPVTAAHSPLPWAIGINAGEVFTEDRKHRIVDNTSCVTECSRKAYPNLTRIANAALIAQSVNERPALLARIEELEILLRAAAASVELANADGDPIMSAWLVDARAALAKP